jgi:hypothetical protein
MSKKKQNYDVKRSNAFKKVSASITKKGKIKGQNKKETKTLRKLCIHHKRGKDGSVKPTVYIRNVNGEPICFCKQCGASFPAKTFVPEKEFANTFNSFKSYNELVKYLSVACRMDPETIDFFADFSVRCGVWKKLLNRTMKIASKHDIINKKKKKKKQNNIYGSWGMK